MFGLVLGRQARDTAPCFNPSDNRELCVTQPAMPPLMDFPVTVSVLTPAHTAAAVLARAVESVQAQGVTDWEMIIVDDGSRDDTYAVAMGLAQNDPRLKVLRHGAQQGAAAARNTALNVAKGRYIAFLDSDDAWVADKLQVQLADMQARGAALSYTGFWREAKGQRHRVRVPATVTRQKLLFGNCIGCLTAIYDRHVFGSVPMPDLLMRQDYALWLALLAKVPVAHGVDQPLAVYHRTDGSLSANKWRAAGATWTMYRAHLGIGRIRAFVYLASHNLRRLWRG